MRKINLLLLLAFFALNKVAAQLPDNLKADTLFHDFETGELFAWEQYPYAQDIGFDALYFARKTPTMDNSKYALAHPVKSYDTHELYQGFTRKINFVASSNASLEAGIYLQSDRNANKLELSVGTKDGQRYFHTIQAPKANEWINVKTSLASFKNEKGSLPVNSELEAITIHAIYDTTYYLYTYTILMDNFRLTGARPRRLMVNELAYFFDAFNKTVLTSIGSGRQSPVIAVQSEDDVPLKSLSAKLFAPNGVLANNSIVFKNNNGKWINSSPLPKKENNSGIWKLELTASTVSGNEFSGIVELLVAHENEQAHPRLFFTRKQLEERKRKGISPTATAILAKAMSDTGYLKVPLSELKEGVDRTGENLVGGPYAQNSVGFDAYAKWHYPMATLEKIIETTAFRYALGGDEKAGQLGKAALLQFCGFKKWNSDWMLNRKFWTYYPVGYAIKAVAYGYDMLFDLMSEEERKFVREAMINKGLKLFHRDMVEMNRMPSNLTNHISVLVSGMGLAAASMYGDDPSMKEMDKYLAGIITKTRAFIENTYYADGSYGEPKSGYMDMATRDLAEWMAGLEHVFGIDFSTTTDVENFYKFPLQTTDHNGLIPAYGDGGRAYGGFTQEHSQWFVHRNGNPYLYKYVKPYWEAGNGGFLGYLWHRDDIVAKDRSELPASRPFEAQGMVMRSGWDSSSTVISTRTGPHSNHYHFDQGSFQIMTNGEELLTDPGIGTGGYYMNTEYLSYNTQSIAHNVLLVDHDPGSQIAAHYDNGIRSLSTWPKMEASFNGELIDAVSADLATVYKGKLESYKRHLIYRKNGPVFLWDQVIASNGNEHVYDWLFHVPQHDQKRAAGFENNRFLVDLPKARLTMDVLYPKDLNSSIRDRNGNTNTYLTYNSKYFSESFLTLSTPTAASSTDFLAVLLPEAKTGVPLKSVPVPELLSGNGWKAASYKKGTEQDVFYCRTENDNSVPMGEIETDAVYVLTSKDASLHSCFFYGSRIKSTDWEMKADKALSVAASVNETIYTIECTSATENILRIKTADKPANILLNGNPVKRPNIQNGWLITPVAKGTTRIAYEAK